MTESPAAESPRRPRTQIWLLIAVFFVPLAAAFLLYYGSDGGSGGWRPAGKTNHGELITPARPLPPVHLSTATGTPLDTDALKGKWTLVYIGDGRCEARCREALTLMRQTRLALNDDLPRVQRLFLVTANCCDQGYLETEHAGLLTALGADTDGQKLLHAFAGDGVDPLRHIDQSGRIYIVDPLGNLMMSYAPGAPPKGLLEDLKKLLKLSHIG